MNTTRHPDHDDVTLCYGTCGRWLRYSQHGQHERPGTVKHYAGGRCRACAILSTDQELAEGKATRQRDLHNVATIGDCTRCGTPMRPHNVPATERPGTIRHISNGICRRCFDQYGAEVLDPEAVRPGFDETHARAALTVWLAERRHRTTHRLAA